MNPVLLRLTTYPTVILDEAKDDLLRRGLPVYDFGVGDPREPTPPFLVEALRRAVPEVSQYPTVVGHPSLRGAIASWCRRRFGVALDPDSEVLPTSGSKEAIFHLPFAFIDPRGPRRGVVVPTPGYPVYERGTLFAGGEVVPLVLTADRDFVPGADQVDEETLSRCRILWVCNPHNPTGTVATLGQLEALVDLAHRHDMLLCGDECYADMHFGDPPPSLLQISRERVLVFHSLSKRSGMTGFRSGFVAGDAAAISALKKFRPNAGIASQDFVQDAAEAAWNDDAHVVERMAVFGAKRAILLEFLRARGFEVLGSRATFYLWARAPGGDDVAYARALLASGVVVMPGSWFGAGGEGFFRLALVPTVDECRRAVLAWGALIDRGGCPS
ncbi:succinyldiaminopimelate transaminase [Myxococcota bacterium]|nr:succinyldiaminopimelate transaminase [Myxococcota bacterium]